MSNVKSSPLTGGELAESKSSRRIAPSMDAPAAAIMMLAFGLPLWAIGAKYSLDGWTIALNIAATVLELPTRLPEPSGWWNLLFLPLGIAYSLVETRARLPKAARAGTWIAVALAIGLTHLTDAGSTYLAVASPGADAWPLAIWVAQQVWPAALWAGFLTYVPEILIITGLRLLGR